MRRDSASRRDFLRKTATVGGALLLGPPLDRPSRVVACRDTLLRDTSGKPDEKRLLKLTDRTLQSLFDCDTPLEAWRRLVKPGDVVGLKVNCLAGKGLSTHVALVEALCERLQEAGIRARDIVIWDRLSEDLESAGFRISSEGPKVRCLGNELLGYDDDLSAFGSAGSLLCKTLTELCSVVISLPVLKDHGIAGVTMALKNLFGAVHNPNKYHGNAGDPYVADVFMLPPIRQKVRLHLCDAVTAQYEGGPPYMPNWSWRANALLASVDPVALDVVGWRMIERKRAEAGLKSLAAAGREPRYIATAADAQHRLGVNDLRHIQLVES
jgi:uncharacterized protein (DUF362 family)